MPSRLRAHTLRPAAYHGPAAGALVRNGVRLLLDPDRGWDRAAAAGRMAVLLTGTGVLDSRLDHQTPEALLSDLDLVYAAARDERTVLVDAVAAFLLEAGGAQSGRLLPEHLQNGYLAGTLNDLYPALLERLCDETWVTAHTRRTDSVALLLMAFRYRQANLMRRSLDPSRMAAARRLLTSSLQLVPAGPPTALAGRYARERSRIHYDLGYLAYLGGQFTEAINQFTVSAQAAAEGGDEVGIWVARALEAQISFEARRIPPWLAQAGLRGAAEQLAALPPDTPHAARWVGGLHEHGFNVAFRARALIDAQVWYHAIQQDAEIRPALVAGRSAMNQGKVDDLFGQDDDHEERLRSAWADAEKRLRAAVPEMFSHVPALPADFGPDADPMTREFLLRFLFSCLVDADVLDTRLAPRGGDGGGEDPFPPVVHRAWWTLAQVGRTPGQEAVEQARGVQIRPHSRRCALPMRLAAENWDALPDQVEHRGHGVAATDGRHEAGHQDRHSSRAGERTPSRSAVAIATYGLAKSSVRSNSGAGPLRVRSGRPGGGRRRAAQSITGWIRRLRRSGNRQQ